MSALEFYTIDTIYECLEKAGCKKEKQEVITLISDYFNRVKNNPDFPIFMKVLQKNDHSSDVTASTLDISELVRHARWHQSTVINHWNKFIFMIMEPMVSEKLKIVSKKEREEIVGRPIQNDEYFEDISDKLLLPIVLNFILYSCFKQGKYSVDLIVNAELPNEANPDISRNKAKDLAKKHVKGIFTILFDSYYDKSCCPPKPIIREKTHINRKKNIYTFTILAIAYKHSCIVDKKYKSELNNYINTHSYKKDGCFEVFKSIQLRLTSQKKQIEKFILDISELNPNYTRAEELINQWANQSHLNKLYTNDKYFITGHTIHSDKHSLEKTYANTSITELPIRTTGNIEQTSITKAAKRFFSDGIKLLVAADKVEKRYRLKLRIKEFDNSAFMYMHKIFVEEIYHQLNNRFLGEV